ncbi:STAS/SEC14 domain-containing protein [Labilibaculum sp. K2S]|nr:STAS/SEC14 domain-containing protein [Labilibaculum sp. K2S]MDM8161308.1 STAS/SEC14 domain-containing protein [Labilibaculum sp. K2S]
MGNSYYNYVEEHKLLVECFCGETKIEDVFELKSEIESCLDQVPKFSVLVDIQENTDKPFHKMNDAFIEFYSKSKLTLKIDRIAVVTHTPSQVVNTILFIDGLKEVFDIPIRVFSSIESSVNWLHSDVSIDKIKSMLEDFKNTIVLK